MSVDTILDWTGCLIEGGIFGDDFEGRWLGRSDLGVTHVRDGNLLLADSRLRRAGGP